MNLIAHRAKDSHHYLENTKEAVLECLNKDYIDGIEIDIRLTKDKQIVVIHNMLIDLLSNGRGFVKDKTLKELKKYTFGKNQKINTLEEILKVMNNKLLLIEIKEETSNYKDIVNATYKLIKKYHYLNVVICSFNYDLLKYLKDIDKSIKCGLIITLIINSDKIYNHLDYNSLNIIDLKKSKDGDFIWTINSIDEYEKIIRSHKKLKVITDIAYQLYKI